MKCYKCGKETNLKNGLCLDCYKLLIEKKHKKSKAYTNNYSFFTLEKDEQILNVLRTSKLTYAFIISIFIISIILFPKTIIEFFLKNHKIYFLLLIFNILFFFLGIFSIVCLASRKIYLTNKRILGKWGIFKVKTINSLLSNIKTIDTYDYKGLEIETLDNIYLFDFVANNENFKFSTIKQIKKLIDSTNDEKILMTFSHSLNEKLEQYKLENDDPNMIHCPCCKQMISKDSILCIHCGHPIAENERKADLFIKILCFVFPPIGLLLFLINIAPYPKFAKQCLYSSLLMVVIVFIIYLSILSIFL